MSSHLRAVSRVEEGREQDPSDVDRNAVSLESPLQRLRRWLHGRYHWAAVAAVAGCLLGAIAGYLREQPMYRSKGLIRITPLMQRILYSAETEKNSPMPPPSIFEAFVQSQVSIIRSEQVIDMVVSSDAWKQAGGGESEEDVARFFSRAEVSHPRRTELIHVSYTSENPQRAQAAVRGMIDAYQAVYGDHSTQERIRGFERTREELEEEIEALRAEVGGVAERYGTDELEEIFEFKMMEVQRLEKLYREARVNLGLAQSKAGAASEAAAQASAGSRAADDPLLRSYHERRQTEAMELERLARSLKPAHPRYQEQQARVESLDRAIERRVRSLADASGLGHETLGAPGENGATLQSLRAQAERLGDLFRTARADALKVGRERLRLDGIKRSLDQARERLAATEARLEQLRVEASVIGRINVIGQGHLPLQPYRDRRRTMALAGGGAGAIAGIALVALLGALATTVRSVADVRVLLPGVTVISWLRSGAGPVREVAARLDAAFATSGERILAVARAGDGERAATLGPGLAEALRSFGLTVSLLHPGGMSARRVRALCGEAITSHDVVLIDAGSIASELDGLTGVAAADRTLLVVAQGTPCSTVRLARERLEGVGACIVASVFVEE